MWIAGLAKGNDGAGDATMSVGALANPFGLRHVEQESRPQLMRDEDRDKPYAHVGEQDIGPALTRSPMARMKPAAQWSTMTRPRSVINIG